MYIRILNIKTFSKNSSPTASGYVFLTTNCKWTWALARPGHSAAKYLVEIQPIELYAVLWRCKGTARDQTQISKASIINMQRGQRSWL